MADSRTQNTLRASRVLSIASAQESLNLDTDAAVLAPVQPAATTALLKQPNRIVVAWKRHISLSVPHDKCRDHLGQSIHDL